MAVRIRPQVGNYHVSGTIYVGNPLRYYKSLAAPLKTANFLKSKKKMKKIVLQFENDKIKNKFLGQLSDGWGENLIEYNRKGNILKITWFEGIDYRTAEEIIKEIESHNN